MLISEKAPPDSNNEYEIYGIARDHAYAPACLAVQKAFEQDEMLRDKVRTVAGHLVLMEVKIAQLRTQQAANPCCTSNYSRQIRETEDSATAYVAAQGLSDTETGAALDAAICVLEHIRANPDDSETPLDLLYGGQEIVIPEPRGQLIAV